MFVIADNMTTRNPEIDRLFQQLKATGWNPQEEPAGKLRRLVERCTGAGALEINIQQHHDRPEVMESAIKVIEEVTDRRICLSTTGSAQRHTD